MNKAIIGLGLGLVRSKNLILSEDFGPQGAMDVLGIWVGQEIVKEMLSQKKITPTISESDMIEKLLEEIRLAENLIIDFKQDNIDVTIQDCLICPKRIGGYDLGGDTACPVGGIILGAVSYLHGSTPSSPDVKLRPGELCNITLPVKG